MYRVRVATDRIVAPLDLPRYPQGHFVYALVSLDQPLVLRYVGMTMAPYERWRTHTRSGVGLLICTDSEQVGMMLISDLIPDRYAAQRLEQRTIRAAKQLGMCDLNAPRRLAAKNLPPRKRAA